jgi:methylthioribose-1-phosphate isomerase
MEPAITWRNGHITAIDQTVLPFEFRVLRITTVDELVEAIGRLAIRGAPVLGAAGALGVALAHRQARREAWSPAQLAVQLERVAAARPTAVNLRREVSATAAANDPEAAALAHLDQVEASTIAMSELGAEFLTQRRGGGRLRVQTHCNTGPLACLGWGTALGVIRALHERGALDHVLVDETRPVLQGARLTCWELDQLGIDHYLVCDGAAPFLIARGQADAVVVGADRIAANGDVANKIGTFSLALAAHRAGIPFLVVAPESTIDPDTPSGADIPIERRADAEVAGDAAPPGTKALNYAFDITPVELVTAVITEKQVIPNGRVLPPRLARSS